MKDNSKHYRGAASGRERSSNKNKHDRILADAVETAMQLMEGLKSSSYDTANTQGK
ncbi:hypothetical protein STSP2_03328 [Anaerohalosphaera lusitana]|uniref:Uncharacterized protein n=1 Tax=Anaerohalosphaera lusitana TaxID=1936003 RepID=A0A1U9NQV6_9BACT|nr:hypothetical protein [Anaerohalosphaera lusitana]AQT70124.1 hypothetical protein STSP2_03328 [Anaerohalosphaera lusitana]